MYTIGTHALALEPDDLARYFVQRANCGDVEGLVALYEPDAVLALGDGRVATGSAAIREFYALLLAGRPQFQAGVQATALRNGDLALTSSRLANGDITVELARRQPDGRWRWLIDQPAIGSS